jgi:hypothetical protein
MVTGYSAWKRAHEEENSICEGEKARVDQFKKNTLIPYYRSMSGGGSRATAGPIVSEFLELYDTLEHKYMSGVTEVFYEVTGLLGISLQDKVDVLDTILGKTYSSPRLSSYRDAIKQKLQYENNMNEHHNDLIDTQRLILQIAIESRNPVALRAALNPGWGSTKFFEQKEYREASTLLNQLEGT